MESIEENKDYMEEKLNYFEKRYSKPYTFYNKQLIRGYSIQDDEDL
jgi:hypothetical protein